MRTLGVAAALAASALAGSGAAHAATMLAATTDAVVRVDEATGHVSPVLELASGFGGFAASPDGTALAYTVTPRGTTPGANPPGVLRVVSNGRTTAVFRGRLIGDVAWSADGSRLLFGRLRGGRSSAYHEDVWQIDRAGGTAIRLLEDASGARWSPDGLRLAYARHTVSELGYRSDVVVLDPATGTSSVIGDGYSPAWSPDGARLAYVSTRDRNGEECYEECTPATELYVADVATGIERRITHTTGFEGGPAWSPDGARIAATSEAETRGIDGELWTFAADEDCAAQLTWSGAGFGSPQYEHSSGAAAACGSQPASYIAPDPRPAGPRMLWLGERFGPRLLSDVEPGLLIYEECAASTAERCGQAPQVQSYSICERYPGLYGSEDEQFRPGRVWRRRGAIVVVWPSSGGFDVYTGTTTLAVFGVPLRHALRFVDRLRPLEATAPHGALPSPRFAAADLHEIRTAPELRAIARRLPRRPKAPACTLAPRPT